MADRDRYKPDRPIFCGNFEYDARQDEIERLFEKFGPLERVDMKTGEPWICSSTLSHCHTECHPAFLNDQPGVVQPNLLGPWSTLSLSSQRWSTSQTQLFGLVE
mmetsp:Transcript_36761/g.103717  ORF Transcript_36761/g.103717 Transcript_36761/m.103717 type:complete len:104 (+) Transcript_36761:183-494(+)